MAQTGYTPISIYYSSTAAATPTAGNLVAGELAINTADGKLFYKDSAGVVQVIAGKGGAGVAAGSNTQVQYNSSGSLAGSAGFVYDGSNIGLGLSNPISAANHASLQIYASTASNIWLTNATSGSSVNNGFLLQSAGADAYLYNYEGGIMAFATSGLERMRITSTGVVGIGITSPGNVKLHIYGTMATPLIVENNQSGSYAQFTNSGGTGYVGTVSNDITFLTSSGGTERMRIDSSGNVGIGTSSPTVKLDVQGIQRTYSTSASTVYNLFQNSLSNLAVGVLSSGTCYIDAINAYPLTFLTSDTERMRIDSSGNVGIGTSSPVYKLDVYGKIQTSSGAATGGISFQYGGSVNSRNWFVANDIVAYGDFGIGQSSTQTGTTYSYKQYFDPTGNVKFIGTVGVGNAIPSTSGAGITFPATQSASSDANTLDDYEEGTWTPTVFGTTTAGTATYGQASATYIKIGKLVQFNLYLEWNSGTGTGFLRVGNLPFTVANANTFPSVTIGYCSLLTLTAGNVAVAYCDNNTTAMRINQYPTGGGTTSEVNYDAAAGLLLSGAYTVA